MTRIPRPRQARAGFTLIELLVVIAIIAVLMGMGLVALQKVRERGTEVAVRDELSQLTSQVTAFTSSKHCPKGYLPSRLVIREDGQYNLPGADRLTIESGQILRDLFGRTGPVDWNGDGAINGAWTLDGAQCLVFFLGGAGGTRGFSTNPANPLDGRTDRIGPHFTFKPERLVFDGTPFPRYRDPFSRGNIYAYFSSYKRKNGYSRYGLENQLGVQPYYKSSSGGVTEYHNSDSFQIVSAGKDGVFGPGGQWPPAAPGNGADDMSNFHGLRLGSP